MSIRLTPLLLAFWLTGDASACSCVGEPLSQMVDDAEYVAVVRIRSVHMDPAWRDGMDGPRAREPLSMEFVVVEAIRGEPPANGRLVSSFPDSGCGFDVHPGIDVLIVTTPVDERVPMHRCSATRVLGQQSVFSGRVPPARLGGDAASYLAAVRAYVKLGTPIPACAHNGFPPLSPEDSIARLKECKEHFERASEVEVRR